MSFISGQKVTLTTSGARDNRSYRKTKRRAIGGAVGFVALPALIPGAGVGLAAGGTAIGMSEPIQGLIGSAIGVLSGSLGTDPEAGDEGWVVEVRNRLSGNNVRVRWAIKRDGGEVVTKEFWHNPSHLKHFNG